MTSNAKTAEGERSRRILIVEDEWIIAADLAMQVRQAGLEPVGPAPSVEAARRLLAESAIDAAILDVSLTEGTSLPLAEDLAARNIPFAFITGYSQQELPEALAGRILLEKPVTTAALLATLKRLLAETPGG